MKKNRKIEYLVFIILLFLQNFALIRTSDFGINGMILFLFLISVLNARKYYFKIKKETFIVLVLGILTLFISSIINNTFYITQIIRFIMIFLLIYISNIYINEIFVNENKESFFKIYTNVLLIFLIYGIYELIANIYSLPLFMNVFANNPSYGERGLYRYYGGWADRTRLYGTFFEPSVFSVFLTYNIFLVKELNLKKLKKYILYVLMLFNLFFTYARTGYVTFVYMVGIYFLYEMILKNMKKTSIVDFLILLLPFFNLILMYFLGLNLFSDLSSLGRTYSAIYYLKAAFQNVKNILFGHSAGSIINSDITIKYIEKQAHNGYVDIIYQFGLIAFVYIIYFLYKKIQKINYKKYLILGVLSTFCCFASYFCVETIIVEVVLIYNFCKNSERDY